jgi:uncharacterized protein (DUF1330 family)
LLEGSWRPARLVLVRFGSLDEGLRWWGSDAYRPLRALRQESTEGNMVLTEGLDKGERDDIAR